MTDDDERLPTPAEGADDEPILSEGVGGVPDIPDSDRATVGDADEVNVDTHEPQTDLNR
jgi:hypothetical protein